MNKIIFVLQKWWTFQVIKKIIITWVILLLLIISLSTIIYLSKNELHQTEDIISLNTKLRSSTLDLHTSIQKLETNSRRFLTTHSESDSINYFSNLDSLHKYLDYLEKLINRRPGFIKYFQPIKKAINEELYNISSLSSSLENKNYLSEGLLKNEEDIYNKIDNYWQIFDDKLELAAFEQIQILHTQINKNLNHFLILIIIYVSLLSLLFLVIIQDVKKRRKMSLEIDEHRKKLEELNNQKNIFFSIIAHDLRSPFAGLISLAEIIIECYDDLSDEERKSHLDGFFLSLKNLLTLIDNLLTWSRLNLDRIGIDPCKIHLTEIIRAVFKSLEVAANNKQIELLSNFNNDIEIFADANMIETVMRNLISNAIKFTNTGGKVIVDIYEKNDYVKLEVRDNGIGMSEEISNNLFKLDVNIKTFGTNNENGTGLGLIICKEFIEKHGGNISVKSEFGKGTVISFTLPKNNNNKFA
jgi:signal transduction histidine kinase